MSSKFARPQDVYYWKTDGEQIEIFTIVNPDADSVFGAPDENITDGLKVIYEVSAQYIDITTADLGEIVPAINDRLYPQLIDYLKSKVLFDTATTEVEVSKSRILKKDAQDGVYQKDGGKVETDDVMVAVPDRRTALR